MASIQVAQMIPSENICSFIKHIRKSADDECDVADVGIYGLMCVDSRNCRCEYPNKVRGTFIGSDNEKGPFEYQRKITESSVNHLCINKNRKGIFAKENDLLLNLDSNVVDAEAYPIIDGTPIHYDNIELRPEYIIVNSLMSFILDER